MKLPLRINAIRHILNSYDKIIAAVSEFSMDEAKEIVRACDVHDELLSALRLAVDAMRAPLDDWKGEVERVALDRASAVIAKAETPELDRDESINERK